MVTTLNEKSKRTIEKRLGLSFSEMSSMSAIELDKVVEQKIGKPLKFRPIADERLIGRGSVYLYLNRLFEFEHKKMDRYIDSIKVRK